MKPPLTIKQQALALKLLSEAETYFCDHETTASDDWFKNLYLLDGSHMILTEEGWTNGSDRGDFEPEEILDEVNAPQP